MPFSTYNQIIDTYLCCIYPQLRICSLICRLWHRQWRGPKQETACSGGNFVYEVINKYWQLATSFIMGKRHFRTTHSQRKYILPILKKNEYQLNLFFKLGQNDDKITLAFYVSSFVLPKTRVKAAIPPPDLAELQVSAQGYLSGCAS